MSREVVGYREQIALISERFPRQEVFSLVEVIALAKRGRKFVKKHLMYDCTSICKAKLALRLCNLT